MKGFNIKRTLAVVLLVLTMTVGVGGGFAQAKTKTLGNGLKVEYSSCINVTARSYLNEGYISHHWCSLRIQETGQYARKNQVYKGWTGKCKINPSTWRTYHYTVSAGRGL